MKLIGLCGYAKAGKNLFADVATNILNDKKVASVSLAYNLRKELYDFVYSKTGYDVFTTDPTIKELLRPMLVAHGNLMRDISNGTYWTDKLESYINDKLSDYDYIFVTDLRYCKYDTDELYWIKQKMKGYMIHIEKFEYQPAPSKRHIHTSTPVKTYDKPANDHELINDPKLKANSDICFEWESAANKPDGKEYIEGVVRKCLEDLKLI